jgi:phage terminase small subunit
VNTMADKLTIKQEKFAQGLFAGLSQREAYKKAYNAKNMADNVIDVKASELSNNGKIKVRLKELQDKLCNRNMVTVERVLQEYARLGFFDPRKLFKDNGEPKEIAELDEDRVFVGYTKKYKLADKKGALDSMAKHLGMFTDKLELSGETGVRIINDIPRSKT